MVHVIDARSVPYDLTAQWLEHLAINMRDQDLQEIRAMSRLSPLEALITSYNLSTHAFFVLDKEADPIAIFGAAPHPLPDVGIVWMLGTDGIKKEAIGIGRRSRESFETLNEAYPLLWNYIDARNTISLKWLRWGGFEIVGEEEDFGPESRHFYIFTRRAEPSVTQ